MSESRSLFHVAMVDASHDIPTRVIHLGDGDIDHPVLGYRCDLVHEPLIHLGVFTRTTASPPTAPYRSRRRLRRGGD